MVAEEDDEEVVEEEDVNVRKVKVEAWAGEGVGGEGGEGAE